MTAFRRMQTAAAFLGWAALMTPPSALAADRYSAGPSAIVDAARQSPPTLDVALRQNGVLVGLVTTSAGIPQKDTPVILSRNGQVIGRTATDPDGRFALTGLSGGTYELLAGNSPSLVRLWAPGTAPPAAGQDALVVIGDPVLRGQGGTGHSPAAYRLRRLLHNPWIWATVIGAAIAIPIAASDDDDFAS